MPRIVPANGSALSDPFPSAVPRVRDRARLAPRTDGDLNDEIENAMAGRFPQGLVAAPKEKRKAGADPRSATSLRTHAHIFLADAHAQRTPRRISRFFAAGLVPRDDVLGGRYSRESGKMRRGFGVFQRE